MSTTSTTDLNAIASSAFGGVAYSGLATYYAALFIGASTGIADGTEATGNSYARVAITNNQTNFPAASAGVVSNGTTITFPQSSGSWGTVDAIRLMDAATDGNVRFGSLITPNVTVDATGITVSIPIGSLTFTVANA